MTTNQTRLARLMVPGGFEFGAPNHREPTTVEVSASYPTMSNADTYVVTAPPEATSFLGRSTAVLSDLAVVTGILFAIALTPIAVVRVVTWAVSLMGR